VTLVAPSSTQPQADERRSPGRGAASLWNRQGINLWHLGARRSVCLASNTSSLVCAALRVAGSNRAEIKDQARRAQRWSLPFRTLLPSAVAGGTAIGVVIAFLFRADNDRKLLENLAIGATLGGACGVIVAFAIALGAQLAK